VCIIECMYHDFITRPIWPCVVVLDWNGVRERFYEMMMFDSRFGVVF
jgi:hypothetical protein